MVETREQIIARAAVEEVAGKAAAADPLPGPLAQAFSLTPEIEVGRWRVRRFVDRDFEFLKALGHPLFKMTLAGMKKAEIATAAKGRALQVCPENDPKFQGVWDGLYAELLAGANLDDGSDFDGRGPAAWQLAWVLTRPVKEVKAAFKAKGVAGVAEAADDEFGDCGFQTIQALSNACFEQYHVYRSTMLEYGAAKQDGDGERAAPERPFPSTGSPTTATGG